MLLTKNTYDKRNSTRILERFQRQFLRLVNKCHLEENDASKTTVLKTLN